MWAWTEVRRGDDPRPATAGVAEVTARRLGFHLRFPIR